MTVQSLTDDLPVSAAQRGLWLINEFHPGSSLYNVFCRVRLTGPLDVDALRGAVDRVVARHETLRSVFPAVAGAPTRRVLDRMTVPVPVDDVAREDVEQIALAWCEQPFDLADGPLLRLRILRLGADEHELCVAMHHIISDGQSLRLFFDELAAYYAGRELAPLPTTYTEELLRTAAPDDGTIAWWRQYLMDAPTLLTVSPDRPRPSVRGTEGATHVATLPTALLGEVTALARRLRMSPFMVLLAAFGALLGRLSRAEDVLVGLPVSGRLDPDTEELIGLFVDTAPVRLRTGAATFAELLAHTRESVLGVLSHQGVPFDRLVDEVRPDRAPSHTPMVQVAFSADLAPYAEPDFPGLRAEVVVPAPTTAKYDLDLSISQTGDDYDIVLTYSTQLYDAATIERFTTRYLLLLAAAVAEPERPVALLPLLDADERTLLVETWAEGPAAHAPTQLVHELFARQAVLTPHAPAISAGGVEHSYAEIDARANGLAARLRAEGVGPDEVVGVLAHRDVDLFVAILGILKADGAYVPLNPTHPPAYLDRVLTTAGARHVVAEPGLAHRVSGVRTHLVDGPPAGPGERRAHPDHLAYVLFTSGSTGEPKGVAVTHRGLSNVVDAMVDTYRITAADRVLQVASIGFDMSVEETFPTWRAGACLVLAPDPTPAPERMPAFMTDERVTFAIPTSSNWARWASAAAAAGVHPGPSLRLVSVGGEAVDAAVVRTWQREVGVPLINVYGLTETTINAAGAMIDDPLVGNQVPIGYPLPGVRTYVLDAAMNPVPVGVEGELYIGGECVVRGYLGRPDLTADRFVPSPFGDGERLHRSGDRARWRTDGRLEVLGRVDNQLKVRGYRIEPGHIEAAISAHPEVTAAVVSVRAGERLTGYVVPRVPADLRDHLTARLPAYLVPSALVGIDTIPVNTNGKADHKALPDPEPVRSGGVAPRGATELLLAGIWQEALDLPAVGVHDNFFELGGSSLVLSTVHSRLHEALDRALSVVTLYEHPTIAALARHLDGAAEEKTPDRANHLRAGRARLANRRRR